MKRLLHLGYDDKFYPGTVRYYNQCTGVLNKYFAFINNNRPVQFVDNCDDILIIRKKNIIVKVIKEGDYDILLIHSLYYYYWDLFSIIPKDKTVIWISFGYDIYSPGPFGVDYKLLQIDSLLPITAKAYNKSRPFFSELRYELIHCYLQMKWKRYVHKIIDRIDYFQPVFHLEYVLLKKNPFFKAKEYYPPEYNPAWQIFSDEPRQEAQGAIQLCNSAGEYGNHLDVWEKIKGYIHISQEVIMPLSYGDTNYANYVKNRVLTDHENTTVMEVFIPRSEYFNIMGRCSYFVHGAVRQHAMANVYHAIAAGRKVFLFKDSLIYRYLKDIGCVVFSIEEIDNSSFRTPLTKEEHSKNIDALTRAIMERRKKGAAVFNTIFDS